jgi:hypothetical protein
MKTKNINKSNDKIIILCFLTAFILFTSNNMLYDTSVRNPESLNHENLGHEKYFDDIDKGGTRAQPEWMNEIRLTNSSGDSTSPDVAVWGDNIHIVWRDDRDGDYAIFYKRSVDNGINWFPDTKISGAIGNCKPPKIAVWQNNIHVVWQSNGINYIKSDSNGQNWTGITSFHKSSYPGSQSLENPDIAVWGNNLYLSSTTWMDSYPKYNLIFKRSVNNGSSWTDWIFVTEIFDGWGVSSSIETNGGTIYIVYWWGTGSGQHLERIESYDYGNTWPNYGTIYNAEPGVTGFLWVYATSIRGSDLHVTYVVQIENIGIYSTMFGRIKVPESDDYDISIDVSQENIFWDEADPNNYRQIYSRMFGQITDTPSNSDMPSIAASGDIVHIVWIDNRDGNNELYYTQRHLLPELIISNSDIHIFPHNGMKLGESNYINATVFSNNKSASNIEVKFYIDNPDTNQDGIPDASANEIGNDIINISKDSSTVASIQWIPQSAGSYEIYVWVDPYNNVQEYNEINNLANNTFHVFEKFTCILKEGWNLISVPLYISDNNLSSVLKSIEGQYDSIQWYDITYSNNSWKTYHILKPLALNNFYMINHTIGFWVYITEAGGTNFTVFGDELTSTQNITLHKGWNLIGYPSKLTRPPDFGLPPSVDMVQWYNPETELWESWDPGSYSPDDLDYMEPGQGFWVHCTQATDVWTVEQVVPPTVDYIIINDAPGGGGNEILDNTVSYGFTLTGYAAAYNIAEGYLGDISVTWSVLNSGGASATTTPGPGTSADFDSGTTSGTAIWTADDGDGHTDTVVWTIVP